MLDKFSKKIIFCLSIALFGGKSLYADESDALMNHHVKAGLIGGMNFMKVDEGLNKTLNIAGAEKLKLKSEGLNWAVGAELGYSYFFNPYVGVGLDLRAEYARMWNITNKTFEESNSASGNDGQKEGKSDKKNVLSAINLAPMVVGTFNFLEEGLMYDDAAESAAGLAVGAKLGLGAKFAFNVGLDDKFGENAGLAPSDKTDEEKLKAIKIFWVTPCGALDFFLNTPFGLYTTVGAEVTGWGFVPLVKPEMVKASENKENKDAGKDLAKFDIGFRAAVGYDFANLFM